ncbi:unnamed protein product [Caretta caretta]
MTGANPLPPPAPQQQAVPWGVLEPGSLWSLRCSCRAMAEGAAGRACGSWLWPSAVPGAPEQGGRCNPALHWKKALSDHSPGPSGEQTNSRGSCRFMAGWGVLALDATEREPDLKEDHGSWDLSESTREEQISWESGRASF